MKNNTLSTNEYVQLINKITNDYFNHINYNTNVPDKLMYIINASLEPLNIKRKTRLFTLKKISSQNSLVKTAFDTRRINQETDRNPRENLQHWSRSDQFINEESQNKINIFSKLIRPLNELKIIYGSQPEWHNSYARVLFDSLNRILRIKQADLDIFQPQLVYLEQLIFNRYRLDMEKLSCITDSEFKEVVLKKDENLLKRGVYLQSTEDEFKKDSSSNNIIKDGDITTQQSVINAIFGNNNIRRDGEKIVERTITITIRDEVK